VSIPTLIVFFKPIAGVRLSVQGAWSQASNWLFSRTNRTPREGCPPWLQPIFCHICVETTRRSRGGSAKTREPSLLSSWTWWISHTSNSLLRVSWARSLEICRPRGHWST